VEKLVRRYNLPTRKEKAGRSYRTLVDVGSLSLLLKGGASERPPEAQSSPEPPPSEKPEWFAIARIAKEYQDLPRGLRWELLQKEASRLGVTPSYLARRVREYLEKGAQAFRKGRRDKGGHRVPAELRRLVVGLKLAHPKASARRILRIISLNDERVLYYRPYSTETLFKLSEATVRRILRKAEENPAFRWALLTEEGRREFARTWAGNILAEYPMQMVMVDMTRCDVFVFNPDEDTAYRLRIHVALDVYSGASPSLVFSREESQVPTDQLLILMTQDKSELAPSWDIFGIPERIYWDNGKVYRSEKSEHFARQLGIELVYSRPRVSHTRGRVERFFGAFHQEFEALLPGYAGRDATERDSTQLKRLIANTRAWVAAGMPPEEDPYPNRLLLEEEYKAKALAWLLQDWHRKPVDGNLSRADIFRAFVPRHRLVRLDLGDLYLLTAYQTERVVRGNGTVAYNGKTYYLRPEDGSLIPWQGQKIVVLDVRVLPGQPLRAALRQPDGSLKVLGELVPEPLRADSLEARAKRAADKAAIRAVREAAQELAAQLGPAVRFEEILERLSGLAPLARRERVRPMAQEPLPRPSEEEIQAAAAELEDGLDDLIWEPIALGEKWLRERGLLPSGEGETGGEA
jgi:putative transposase